MPMPKMYGLIPTKWQSTAGKQTAEQRALDVTPLDDTMSRRIQKELDAMDDAAPERSAEVRVHHDARTARGVTYRVAVHEHVLYAAVRGRLHEDAGATAPRAGAGDYVVGDRDVSHTIGAAESQTT